VLHVCSVLQCATTPSESVFNSFYYKYRMLKISLIILSLVALVGVGISNNVFANNLPPTGGIAGSSSDNSNTAMGNSGTSDNGWNSGGQSSVPASNINGGTSEYNYGGVEPWHHHHYFGESSIDPKGFWGAHWSPFEDKNYNWEHHNDRWLHKSQDVHPWAGTDEDVISHNNSLHKGWWNSIKDFYHHSTNLHGLFDFH
jgi:hypothetical protein